MQAFPFALPHGIMLLLPSISDVHLKRLGRVLEDRARLPAEVNKSLFSLTKSVYSGPSDCYSRGTGGGVVFQGVKNGRKPDTDPLPPCGAEDKNVWNYTSSSPYTFMVYTGPISLLTEKERTN